MKTQKEEPIFNLKELINLVIDFLKEEKRQNAIDRMIMIFIDARERIIGIKKDINDLKKRNSELNIIITKKMAFRMEKEMEIEMYHAALMQEYFSKYKSEVYNQPE